VLLLIVLIAPIAYAQPAACGYVSAAAKPPQSDSLYPAAIRRIDGKDLPTRALSRYPLSVGKHSLSIQELVADTPRGYTALRKLGNKEVAVVYKIIEIDVAPNMSYQIGAKLDKSKIDPKRPNDFWEPVVWKTLEQGCG